MNGSIEDNDKKLQDMMAALEECEEPADQELQQPELPL